MEHTKYVGRAGSGDHAVSVLQEGAMNLVCNAKAMPQGNLKTYNKHISYADV
jgi:hypothetical protein